MVTPGDETYWPKYNKFMLQSKAMSSRRNWGETSSSGFAVRNANLACSEHISMIHKSMTIGRFEGLYRSVHVLALTNLTPSDSLTAKPYDS
jgi:hypothetical protein